METIDKKFETTADVLEDVVFQEKVKNIITTTLKGRAMRLPPKEGLKYKRDWYDRFTEQHPFTYEFFMENIDKVLLKESNLRSESRKVIAWLYNEAFMRTVIHYDNLKKAQEKLAVKE